MADKDRHYVYRQGEVNPFECIHCGKRCSSEGALNLHVYYKHQGGRKGKKDEPPEQIGGILERAAGRKIRRSGSDRSQLPGAAVAGQVEDRREDTGQSGVCHHTWRLLSPRNGQREAQAIRDGYTRVCTRCADLA